MKIETLGIRNFRGIREVDFTDLRSMVIIAGQNGSGKSCIFDAIRLLKSVYGGYQQNEWQQWMGEFQIQLSNRSSDFTSIFNDPTKELRILCDFRLASDERTYISSNADALLTEVVWRTILPEAFDWGGFRMAMFSAQFRDRQPEVTARVTQLRPALIADLAKDVIRGECFIPVGGLPQIINSVALSVIFSLFRPRDIGVIDYHGAQRHYGREYVQGINLNLDQLQQQRSQSTLYNSAAKYNNVKSEMAGSYLRELLAEKAGVPESNQSTLTNTLKELFTTFFPEKEFLGPQPTPDGGLSFPVRTIGGNTHDLDELSAGEKEILYGYLRIRNSAPRNSIILLDEPELHLNPRLIRGLPQFYQRNLGEALGNQIWLVSHSDALLREVIGREKYNVFHMLPCGNVGPGQSQLKPLLATADLELALVDLVGDLASYRPGRKVVIFEGGGDSDFDQRVTASLFPELQEHANLISGSNKARVKALHETLVRASQKGQLPFQFFAVTDRDSVETNDGRPINGFSWDVYHIENYFLDAKYIARVLASLTLNNPPSEEEIADELRNCARETLPQLLRHELSERANTALIDAINTGTDPNKGDIAGELRLAVERSIDRLTNIGSGALAADKLKAMEAGLVEKFENNLADGSWTKEFRGRDILRRFAGKRAQSVPYESFRNLILSQMKDDGFRPAGMKQVVDAILGASS
jgi:predicted ATPase